MVSTKEIIKEYRKLNLIAGQTNNELDHNSLMERINLTELYYNYYLEKDTIMVYKTPIMDNNQP